ncbi:hypothetical protein SAMN04488077_1327 [Roseovarius tolerans]|uniref:Uncharacterized protein n=2 Tax=Roseovarius tolerans TaxID=74031 RepID=A0A1H8JJH5_9RHOB|nr:hypothetical protein SAMN04488077_1327 [Roseovarius tolerans]
MRDKSEPDKKLVRSRPEEHSSTGAGPIDPHLQAIRSLIELDDEPQAVGRAGFAQTEADNPAPDTRDPASAPSNHKTSLAQWLLELGASFFRRPDAPRILSILLLLTVFVWRPGFIIFLVLVGLMIGVVLYFSFGPDQVQNWVISRYRRLAARDPDAAERIRRRAAAASQRLSAVIEKLPERWTAGLYLPDFEEPADLPEKWNSDPFDRLKKQSHGQ